MNEELCRQPGCTGVIEDGYCNLCGHAAARSSQALSARTGAGTGPMAASASVRTGTGSTPISRSSKGSHRVSHGSARTTRKQLGAGLITLPDLPSLDPEKAILADSSVPERKRFCAKCEAPLRREAGFCGKCGTRYSFVPSLRAGDLVAGQYEVRGPIAFGGLGWIYLAFDRLLSRYVVLKGLLNTQDASAAAAAVAERQFLAAVKHPNIVGIYNFVTVGTEGFIVMEYVGGKTLKQIRQERGPLPPAEALAYIHRILPAFAYLHRLGLVYCDFKPDNMMLERDDVKLIDLGGVRRIDDTGGDIYGTVGYSAPEAGAGPTPASDLFTIGRTLAVLLTDIRGFSKEHRYTLPDPGDDPRLSEHESMYRLLLKATAQAADDRFEDADEMAEQTLGTLREVVAIDTGVPRPGASSFFGVDQLALDAGDEMLPVSPDPQHVPLPTLDTSDAGAQAASSAIAQTDAERRLAALRMGYQQFPKSREMRLRLAGSLIDTNDSARAMELLDALAAEDAWDWRVLWYQARLHLSQNRPAEARRLFDQVYFDLPGELAPKLALGVAAELAGEDPLAIRMYDLVSRVDTSFVSAVFGLARCLERAGDRKGAVEALARIPSSSALSLRARIQAMHLLVGTAQQPPRLEDLAAASEISRTLSVSGLNKQVLVSQILGAAVQQVHTKAIAPASSASLCGVPVEEGRLRLEWERALREMAKYGTPVERIRLVDQANQVRPRTLF